MSRALTDTDDIKRPAIPTGNDQLLLPALSPISEHGGEQSTQPFTPWGRDIRWANGHAVDGYSGQPDVTGGRDTESGSGISARMSESEKDDLQPVAPSLTGGETPKILKLSPAKLHELTTSPASLHLPPVTPLPAEISPLAGNREGALCSNISPNGVTAGLGISSRNSETEQLSDTNLIGPPHLSILTTPGAATSARPSKSSRSVSSPVSQRKQTSSKGMEALKSRPSPLKIDEDTTSCQEPLSSPTPSMIPLPPLSLPTYLQLELSTDRPSVLYIHRSGRSDIPYESSKVKFERLLNFLLLPPQLEQVLLFGALACLDSWLYTFTILPLRFLKAISLLLQWWLHNAANEAHNLGSFVYRGVGRVWRRRRDVSITAIRRPSISEREQSRRSSVTKVPATRPEPKANGHISQNQSTQKKLNNSNAYRHHRTRSTISALSSNHKADIMQGLLIIISCIVLMSFDASRMYHSIRGQAAIKLYVIYNVLEVCDKLFSALGQDVLECLFSKETLERDSYGRSKIIRPLWMFCLALGYNLVHATALFYQVVTLNVAVNSYSNALLTLLMSNQFVEIKGAVFKKFEKENLFQLTCADVVERFQLWLMLLIIALRNIVEVGGLSISLGSAFTGSGSPTDNVAASATGATLRSMSIVPHAFTLIPRWTGQVFGPFLIVLGSEMLVDWLKHAYISKFNNIKPNIYGRFLDVLAKDYYSHAFADQNLTKRLGLPVIPLSCLFIRASMQTYHMLLATHMPPPIPSPATSISMDSVVESSPATVAALAHIDQIFRRALGHSSFGGGDSPDSTSVFSVWTIDDLIAFATMLIFFLVLYLILLACKLVLGMLLLNFAHSRYKGMKERERQSLDTHGKRVGGWGMTEVNEDKRQWIYKDDPDGLRNLQEREGRARTRAEKGDMKLDGVGRYMMAAKRIW